MEIVIPVLHRNFLKVKYNILSYSYRAAENCTKFEFPIGKNYWMLFDLDHTVSGREVVFTCSVPIC